VSRVRSRSQGHGSTPFYPRAIPARRRAPRMNPTKLKHIKQGKVARVECPARSIVSKQIKTSAPAQYNGLCAWPSIDRRPPLLPHRRIFPASSQVPVARFSSLPFSSGGRTKWKIWQSGMLQCQTVTNSVSIVWICTGRRYEPPCSSATASVAILHRKERRKIHACGPRKINGSLLSLVGPAGLHCNWTSCSLSGILTSM
jgi:hypothetical protein